MKITIIAIVAATVIAPANAKTATCLDWVRFIAMVTKGNARIAANMDVPSLSGLPPIGGWKEAAKSADELADAANNALIQCSIELSPR
jgi:hypothetical protein